MGLKRVTVIQGGKATNTATSPASPQKQAFKPSDDEATRVRQLNDLADRIEDAHQTIATNPHNSHTLIPNVALFAGVTTKVQHFLGKPFSGYQIVRQQGAPFNLFEPTRTPYTAAINASTNASPIVITTTLAHGFATGTRVYIANHAVNTKANGQWSITVTSATAFSLDGSSGNGIGGATGSAVGVQLAPAIASSTNATPIVVTTLASHNLQSGDDVMISGHAVNTSANGGPWTITVLSATTFSIPVAGVGVGGATGVAALSGYDTSREIWFRSGATGIYDVAVY